MPCSGKHSVSRNREFEENSRLRGRLVVVLPGSETSAAARQGRRYGLKRQYLIVIESAEVVWPGDRSETCARTRERGPAPREVG